MAKKPKSGEGKRPIESYEHKDKKRVNNPPVGLVTPDTDPDADMKKTYAYDPHLDPQLQWAGKAEHISFEVPTVSLHVHERIDPRTVIEAVRKFPSPQPSPDGRGSIRPSSQPSPGGRGRKGEGVQLPLFALPEENPPLRQAIEFYKHAHGWSNRLVAGDSLLVMNSLLEKEGLAGKVQMIYIDPPYGIKYGSNFQPFVNKRDVKDGKDEDLTTEPEQIRAFRDTWELGLHSYLTYLRDRLLLARELLAETGGVFVQISDENIHHVRELMDEVFGAGNFVSLITFKKSGSQTAVAVPTVGDYLIWYCKDKLNLKFRSLYQGKEIGLESTEFRQLLLKDGTTRTLIREELTGKETLPEDSRVFKSTDLHSRSGSESTTQPYVFQGKIYRPRANAGWRTTIAGLRNLENANRLLVTGNSLRYVHFFQDFPFSGITSIWDDVMGEANILYVVQTNQKVIQRCLLMTTDPGDLVFDPTCGSGTTAYVAEQWGRRWITCDTSRVALTLARQRLMTAVYDYYELAHPLEGVGSGFKYKTVPHVTLKSIANNPEIDHIHARWQARLDPIRERLNALLREKEPANSGGKGEFQPLEEWEIPEQRPDRWPPEADVLLQQWRDLGRKRQADIDAAIARHAAQETLYDQPLVDRKRKRVSGPFTVEAVPAPAVKSVDDLLSSLPSPLPMGEGGRRPGEGKTPLDPDLLELARKLRQEQTDAEQLLWALLRDRRLAGFKFRRQHPIDPYILDFYCHEARLGIELDGGQHNEPEKEARDRKRSDFLAGQGIRVLRFWNHEVFNQTEAVLQSIYEALTLTLSQKEREHKTLTPALSRREREHEELTPGLSKGEREHEFDADLSIARSGETLRQGEWRDELLRTGIRGKAGQYIRFARLEPLPGCRWLHADAETRPSAEGANSVRENAPAYNPMRAVVSFGPEHAPLEQRQVAHAIDEA